VPGRARPGPRHPGCPGRRARPDLVVRADGPVGPGPAAAPLTAEEVSAGCRVVRFFTHLPGAGPAPGKPGGPRRTHKRRAAAARRGTRRRREGTPQQNHPPAAPASAKWPAAKMHEKRRSQTVPEKKNVQEKHGSNSQGIVEGARIISYNLNEDERPGGMRVR